MLSQSLRVLSVRDQASICPFALREVSVLAELALGHLRYSLTDVPPQSNSPPGGVLEIRIAPGPGPAVAARATPGPPVPAERTVGSRRPTARRRGDPRFDARCPRLALNATGISTAVPHGRAQADGRARARRAGPVGQTRPDRAAEGRTRPRREPRVPLHRVSGETMRVVVFHRRRGGRRPRDRRPEPPAST
jgi:hypothetical protein